MPMFFLEASAALCIAAAIATACRFRLGFAEATVANAGFRRGGPWMLLVSAELEMAPAELMGRGKQLCWFCGEIMGSVLGVGNIAARLALAWDMLGSKVAGVAVAVDTVEAKTLEAIAV